ncbi:MAG: ANTAR domain-containing protein [Planctomycetota bacterium]
MPEPLNVILAHGSDDLLKQLEDSLNELHTIVAKAGTVAELRACIRERKHDLVVTGVMFPDGDGLDLMIEIGDDHPFPSVVVTSRRSLELVEKAMEDHVMAYLLEPIRGEELEAAIVVARSRFDQLEALTEEVTDLRQALADRKIIERAKGILMAADEQSELEAYQAIRSRAQSERRKLAAVAQAIVDDAGTG